MARISTYPIDDLVTGNDKWIGSDVSNKNATKNFTPNKVADFLNSSNKIDSQSLRYMYQDWQLGDLRQSGTISFSVPATEPIVPFSDISSFKISKFQKGSVSPVSTFYTSPLIGSYVLITNAEDITNWAIYKWDSAVQDVDELNFWDIGLTLLSSLGGFEEESDYLISLLQIETLPSDKNFVYTQGAPSSTWVVTHNLDKYPSVTVVDSANSIVVGSVEYDSVNQVTLTFSSDFSGKAFFN